MEELDKLIQKFWAGQTTNAEDIQLLQMLADDKEILVEFSDMQDTMLNSEKKNELLDRLHVRMNVQEGSTRKTGQPFLHWSLRYWVAAASVVLVLAGMFAIYSMRGMPHKEVAQHSAVGKEELVQLVNSSDSVQHIALADGSVIKLFPESGISYYKSFSVDKRDISLHGMAEFKVAKDSARPFSVYTGALTTTALGTTFVVDAPVNKNYINVRLIEGKVVLRAARMKAIYLYPGQECEYVKDTGETTVKELSKAKPQGLSRQEFKTAPTPGRKETLMFVQKPLSDVFDQIGRHYGVRIESADPQVNVISFSGSFFETDSLRSVLKIICDANHLTFQEQQNKITIEKVKK
ncbi:FecR family protein [Dyadobacter chenwenxiniae]|uniref:FecR family protein n=1 Tax=Dyadobacter chenwenxiniae TaxID=2906456 RepID=A0A9X1PKQ1_9BACT|nr:FecR family protein [Dyadobacter chenwenxiniae]MCF0063202.1 FecR family protein [Dyadobacter chenwenxiniae]UON85418.1 FecR family protein [Dyadobacter chenwenxiniae]